MIFTFEDISEKIDFISSTVCFDKKLPPLNSKPTAFKFLSLNISDLTNGLAVKHNISVDDSQKISHVRFLQDFRDSKKSLLMP